MKYFFHPEAESEFQGAIEYYEKCELGLGQAFVIQVYSAIRNIITYPNMCPILERDIRRCLVNRFPFGILYSIEENEIFILAVMHLRRNPDYWKHRK